MTGNVLECAFGISRLQMVPSGTAGGLVWVRIQKKAGCAERAGRAGILVDDVLTLDESHLVKSWNQYG